MKLDYEHYLFSNLLKLYDTEFDGKPYDIQFDSLPALYKHFENSPFNVSNKGLYDCILDYLNFRFKTIK